MKNIHKINQNIYITSDDEIKERDWFLDDNNQISHSYRLSNVKFSNPKKIILTDNKDLIKDGVQAIDDDFLEWFVNNPSCEEVMIETFMNREYEWGDDGSSGHTNFYMRQRYKIIIPKEEPKQETIEEVAKEVFKGEYICNGIDIVPAWREGFVTGAKWQQERMYSEEEVLKFSEWIIFEVELYGCPTEENIIKALKEIKRILRQ